MHLVAEIIFIFLIVYLTGSSSEFCSIVFFYSSTFYQLPFFAETRRNKIDKKVPALYIISSLKLGNMQRGKKYHESNFAIQRS